jgi:hypothetical protein
MRWTRSAQTSAPYTHPRTARWPADGVVRWPADGPLQFVPDELMDDPERTKAGLRDAYSRLLDLDFDRLLLAHGDPIVHGAKDELFASVERA